MLVGGLWHGAAWRFVFWGAMHGAGLAVHKASRPYMARLGNSWPVKTLCWLTTMSFVAALWVFFRADSAESAITLIGTVFTDFDAAYMIPFAAARTLWLILILIIVVAHCMPTHFWDRAAVWFVRTPWIVKIITFLAVIQCVIELRSSDVTPFIYFQF